MCILFFISIWAVVPKLECWLRFISRVTLLITFFQKNEILGQVVPCCACHGASSKYYSAFLQQDIFVYYYNRAVTFSMRHPMKWQKLVCVSIFKLLSNGRVKIVLIQCLGWCSHRSLFSHYFPPFSNILFMGLLKPYALTSSKLLTMHT